MFFLFLRPFFDIGDCLVFLELLRKNLVYNSFITTKNNMRINRMPFKSQPMTMVHKSRYGTELWLGDYFGATNLALLKQK